MNVIHIRPGLWYWTTPHPDWEPSDSGADGWDQDVGCAYYEGHDATVLLDPLLPPPSSADRERFWRALDRDVQRRALPVAILLSASWHERSAQDVYDRYRPTTGANIWIHEASRSEVACTVTHTFRDGAPLPGGVIAFSSDGPIPTDTVFFIPAHRAIFAGDALLGAPGAPGAPGDAVGAQIGAPALRVCPSAWWPGETGQRFYQEQHVPALRRLLDLPIDIVLIPHGAPVLQDGHAALAAALIAAPGLHP